MEVDAHCDKGKQLADENGPCEEPKGVNICENEMDVMQPSEENDGGEEDAGNEDSDSDCDNEDEGSKAKKRPRKTMVTRSKYWDHFEKFVCKVDKIQKAKCKYCGTDIKADPRVHGTTPIKNHFRNCKKKPRQVSGSQPRVAVQQSLGGDNKDPQLVSWKFDQAKVRDAVRYMILVDELPLKTVEKLGFKHLMSVACPMFRMSSRRAMTRNIYEFYCEEKKNVKSFIKNHCDRICITTDTWTSIQKINYMCLTAHFIDDDWKLQKRILNFCPISGHKSEEIGKGIEKCLLDWGIDRVFTITVDNASSNNGAIVYLNKKFDNWGTNLLGGKYVHMRCIAHIVNLIVQDGLKNKEEHVATSRIRGAIRYIRNSPARYNKFKECVRFEKLDTNKLLSLDVPTRWNSTYLMLESAVCLRRAFEAYQDIDLAYVNELSNSPYDGVPVDSDWEKAALLLKFLGHFYKLTLCISGSSYVTSNHMFHEISAVEMLLKEWVGSSDFELSAMSKRMKDKYEKYWGKIEKMNMILYFAVILDPRHKLEFIEFYFDALYDDASKCAMMKNKVKSDMQEMFETYKKLYGSPESLVVPTSSSSTSGLNASSSLFPSSTLLKEQFKKFKSGGRNEHVKTELEKYLCEDYENDSEVFDILKWWKDNSHRFPVLSKMARDVFAVQVSTVASESTFSTGGRVLDAFRSSLSTKIVQALICAQDWLRSNSIRINEEEDLGELEMLEKDLTNLGIDSTIVDV